MQLLLFQFSPFCLPPPVTSSPSRIRPPLSSCPWVVHVSSLASPLPILFLTYPCLSYTYQLCFLVSVPFPTFPPFSPQLITLQMISISIILFLFLLVCLVCFCFLDSVVDSCEVFVILLFIVLIFFLHKSL